MSDICITLLVSSYLFMCGEVFFFFKQKTAYEMRISDWSSDVCSSDLTRHCDRLRARTGFPLTKPSSLNRFAGVLRPVQADNRFKTPSNQIGRASCRERVCQYV